MYALSKSMRSTLGLSVLDEDYTLFREFEVYAAAQTDEHNRQAARERHAHARGR